MKNKIICWSASWEYGQFWFRLWTGWGMVLKAPWCEPLFSEVYGHEKYFPKKGWRVGILDRHKLEDK